MNHFEVTVYLELFARYIKETEIFLQLCFFLKSFIKNEYQVLICL